uniref:NADH dehydrogenase subunit 6 n=1 Tax=Cyriopagopus schmidti TaxID=29017 RepID=Q6JT22_CYRSC|nr:NADH dehydrogenase subunit 6 [Cyriopagopus schmidti]AAP51156.1 NADH dehydrogenase subunit 6 [Cyriopagopus schmidti]
MWLKMIVLMSLIFMISTHPMSLVMAMMVIVLMYSLEMYWSSGTFLYSMVLMLIILSGVMVIFTYMASMNPNEKFEFFFVGMMIMLLFSFYWGNEWKIMVTFEMLDMWNSSIMVVSEYLVSFLLVIMFMTIWISGWWYGPLRV